MLLSHICKPALIKIAGKKSWKPTLAECQEGFIYHVKVIIRGMYFQDCHNASPITISVDNFLGEGN